MILLYVPSLSSGGAERVALLIAQALEAQGAPYTLLVASTHGDFASHVPRGLSLHDLECAKPIRGLRRLSTFVDRSNAEAVICFGVHTGIAACLSRAIFGWRSEILIRIENNLAAEWQDASPLNRLIGPALSRWAGRNARLTAVSEALCSASAEFLRIPQERVVSIPNPVFAQYPEAPDQEHALHPWLAKQTCPTLVAVGRLESQKGFDVLIKAMALAQERAACRLVIFGVGSLHDALLQMIGSLGLRQHVALAGFTPSPITQMGAARAFVLSSRYEGFGLVLVEALAAGTRVISTDCDFGPPEILEEGKWGKLVPVDNAEELADAIVASVRSSEWPEPPPLAWFDQFLNTRAAQRHLELIRNSPTK